MNKRRRYNPQSGREKVGSTEVKISPKILTDIRNRVLQMKNPNNTAVAKELAKEFTQFSPTTMESYVAVSYLPAGVFQMYVDGKFSYGILRELATGIPMEAATFLAEEFIERKMTPAELIRAKGLMREGECDSWGIALDRATGVEEVQIVSPLAKEKKKEQPKSFDDLVTEILKEGTEWRLKVKMVIDFLPQMERNAVESFTVFQKIYFMRHALQEQFVFVDKTVKNILDRMTTPDGSERTPAYGERERSTEEGPAEERGPESAVHGVGQVLPSAGTHAEEGR